MRETGLAAGFRQPTWRRRLLISLLAVATAVTVIWMMLERPGGLQWQGKPARPDAPRCAAGQTTNCVGGQAEVIMAPQAPSAATPAAR